MTCYETLRAPAPAADNADVPMAHHFVKWWRNKFRNGYKKFSIGNEGERTDTEELVGRAASQCSAPPDLLPSEARALLRPATPVSTPSPARAKNQTPPASEHHGEKPRLRFEELTCDVELQHPEPSKLKPLQFSFTLYDLDGHGRMTKDDIAGIVSTIYESIGKSVTVPHYGSKTIQVKLTVAPDNGCFKEHRRKYRRKDKNGNNTSSVQPECEVSDEELHSRLSCDDSSSKSSSDGQSREHTKQVPQTRRSRYPRREHRERKHKKRSGSLQRRELLEIIQANMEKNHLSFQTSRKPCDHVANEEEITNKYQKIRNRAYTISEKPVTFHKKVDQTNGYLDLASGGDSNLCRYDRYLHAVICSSVKHAHSGYHQHKTHRQQPPNRREAKTTPSHPRVLQIIFL